MSAEFAETPGQRKLLRGEREHSIAMLSEHYQLDLRFASRVRQLAEQFFKQLAPVHALPASYGDMLSAAAALHEAGSFLNRAGRHRHTHYILSHSELFGFTIRQRLIIAAIARYVGKSKPSAESRAIRALPVEDRLLVPRAVLLLRLARSLEQGRRGAVQGVRARVEAGKVTLKLKTRASGAELERWAVEKEKGYFLQVFGRALECEGK